MHVYGTGMYTYRRNILQARIRVLISNFCHVTATVKLYTLRVQVYIKISFIAPLNVDAPSAEYTSTIRLMYTIFLLLTIGDYWRMKMFRSYILECMRG